jgi:UDPglucose 6-dehydrogenase
VLVRHHGRRELISFERLYARLEAEDGELEPGVIEPERLEVLSWLPGTDEPRFMPVSHATRRRHEGEILEVRTKMGRRVRATPDHPFLVGDGASGEVQVKLADDLTESDWLPLAQGTDAGTAPELLPTLAAVDAAGVDAPAVIVRPRPEALEPLSSSPRWSEIRRTGTARLDEIGAAEAGLRGAAMKTAKNGAEVPLGLTCDERFWRVVGLYVAEGHTSFGARDVTRIAWSFHPDREQHLVDEVMSYWMSQGVRVRAARRPTAHQVTVQSRLLGAFWHRVLGLGRTSYEQRLPDLIWEQTDERKWALLSGLFEGDGSWSLVNGGPSVIIEFGTISRELADGAMRLLGDLGIVASQRIGRSAKSTADTYWLRIAGADQVERAIALVPERDWAGVHASIARQAKRIAPTGYRRFAGGPAWARVTDVRREPFAGDVYSLEVPGVDTFVTTGGVTVHNCFPKDVSALKQLAGNSGYHFQLLNAVIEVNELQKRRVIGKLEKHLGTLVGKHVALLGLAFKPNTDDMRDATSLVLSARLQAAGAHVSAYDPIAEDEARRLMPGLAFADDALGCVTGADAVVLVTEWEEFKALDLAKVADAMAGTVVIDGRNALDPEAVRAAGLVYEGIGQG